MTTRFWIGAAVGAVLAWYFFTPRGQGGDDGNGGVGGPSRRIRGPRGQAGYSGFGRWR